MEGVGGLKDMRVGEKGFVSEAEEQNKALVRRFLEAVQKGDSDTMHELLSPDFVDHSLLPGQEPGRDGYIEAVAEDHAAFSAIRYHIEDMVVSGDKVITRHTTRAIHDGRAWMSITPDGREWDVMAILIHRISGGRIVEEWSANSVNPILEDLQQELRERERIEQELQVARRIQQASLQVDFDGGVQAPVQLVGTHGVAQLRDGVAPSADYAGAFAFRFGIGIAVRVSECLGATIAR